jgi:septal ring factor EnvC (AmiA/AmiB activator)
VIDYANKVKSIKNYIWKKNNEITQNQASISLLQNKISSNNRVISILKNNIRHLNSKIENLDKYYISTFMAHLYILTKEKKCRKILWFKRCKDVTVSKEVVYQPLSYIPKSVIDEKKYSSLS